ncbi:MAG: PQQ-binding-like beta-propeller repeat protein [Bryobacterales bacterium]
MVWKAALPEGKSSPVVVGDRIFLTAAEGDDLLTICLDRESGKELWRRSVRAGREDYRNELNARATPTPATDGSRVFVFFQDYGLAAYDFAGKPLWDVPLGPFNSQQGVAASPVYVDGRVVLVCDQDTDAYVIAVDAANGEIVWKKPRQVTNGYSTPTVYRPEAGPAQIIAVGSYEMTAYSPDGYHRVVRARPHLPTQVTARHRGRHGLLQRLDGGQ